MHFRQIALAAITLAGALAAPILPAHADKPLIGAVLYARDSAFWRQVERGMQDAAAANNVDLDVVLNRR